MSRTMPGPPGKGKRGIGIPEQITSVPGTVKTMVAEVDIRRLHGYAFCRSPEGEQGLAGMNCRAAAKSVSSAPVKASAADARPGKFGSGVRAGRKRRRAGCRRAALPQAAVQ